MCGCRQRAGDMTEWRARRQQNIEELKKVTAEPYKTVETAQMKFHEQKMSSRAVLSPRKHPVPE